MGQKLSRSYFVTKEAYFVGYSRKTEAYCKSILKAFREAGTRVFPVNPSGTWGDETIYRTLEEVPARPDFAFVLTGRENSAELLDQLAGRGVKRVLFGSSLNVDKATLQACTDRGMEAAVACPLMAFGTGFHRFHGWLAGVRA